METDREYTERVGIGIAMEFFSRSGVIFREQPIADRGIDAQIEIENPANGARNLIALQIKCGQSYFKSRGPHCYRFYFDRAHYAYWTSYSIPVLLLLIDDRTEAIVWEHICPETIRETEKGYVIDVPKDKLLTEAAVEELIALSDKPQYIKNIDYLRLNLPLIEAIEEQEVILEANEWVNKCSGRGEIKLNLYDDTGALTETLAYAYWFPFQMYCDVFRNLFPWADFEPDDEFYYEDDLNSYHENYCIYDPEDGVYYDVDTTFEEYRKSLPKIRYVLAAGEVGYYKLRLKLNRLGKAFLTVNEYLESGRPYEGVKSS